jgi:hypothetical protein
MEDSLLCAQSWNTMSPFSPSARGTEHPRHFGLFAQRYYFFADITVHKPCVVIDIRVDVRIRIQVGSMLESCLAGAALAVGGVIHI